MALKLLLDEYDRQVRSGNSSADEVRAQIREYPFSSVLVWLLGVSVQPGAKEVIGSKLLAIIERHQVATWLE